MKIIEPSAEIYREPDHRKKIETIARVCTGTQDKVGTKPDFVENLWKNHHETPFEHVRVKLSYKDEKPLTYLHDCYGFSQRLNFPFRKNISSVLTTPGDHLHIVNGRDYLKAGGTLEELMKLKEGDDYMTVKFVCDIGISRELIRHRQFSFQERSTRYCNMKDGVEFIRPVPFEWGTPDPLAMGNDIFEHWKTNCIIAERNYQWMIDAGRSPQEARLVLSLSTATVLYVTGMISQWHDLLKLRTDKAAHPQMRYLMNLLLDLPDCPEELKKYKEEK